MTTYDEDALCEEARVALAQGDLHRAADLCKSLLGQFPASARGYHLTSSLFQATGNYRKAYDYSAMAAQMASHVVQYHVQQGHMLYLLKEYEPALAAFARAAELGNHHAETCRWLGNCLVALERFGEAKAAFAKARAAQATPDIAIDEARCSMQSGECDAAENILAEFIEGHPHHAEAHYQLALLAIALSEFSRAEALLGKALFLDPRHVAAQFYSALLLADSGESGEAAGRLLEALKLEPTHVPSLLMLGGIFMGSGDDAAAEKAFLHALSLAPDHLLAWYSLLELLYEHGRGREGNQRLGDAIASVAQPQALRHLRALFAGDVPQCAPREFTIAFYGAFADMFEPWVIANGSAPHVEQLIAELTSELGGRRHLSLLDVGCATGVLAEKLGAMTAIRVGVDRSPHMLKIARRSRHYDVLYEMDLLEYVLGSEMIFDLVVSAGALRWVGNLQPFFLAVRGVMHKDSLLAFLLEKEPSTLAYCVANHGRYSHQLSYVRDIAQAEGLALVRHKEVLSEISENDKMMRHLFIFRKMTLH